MAVTGPVPSAPVRVLLPPSEAKTTGGRGRPLGSRDSHPVLATHRSQLLDALEALLVELTRIDAVVRAER